MAYFQKTKLGQIRAFVEKCGVRKSATLPDMASAEAWAKEVEDRAQIKHAMRSAAENRFLMSAMPRRVLTALADAPFSKEEILAGSIGVPQKQGVYFLIREGDVRYVGKSKDVFERIRKHMEGGWRFDAFNVIFCKEEELLPLEQTYIEAFMPDWNQTIGRPAKGIRINTRKHKDGPAFEVHCA